MMNTIRRVTYAHRTSLEVNLIIKLDSLLSPEASAVLYRV